MRLVRSAELGVVRSGRVLVKQSIRIGRCLTFGCLLLPAAGRADTLLNFVFTGPETAHFVAKSDPTPDFSVSGSLTDLEVPYATNGSTSEQGVTFYSSSLNGGVFTPASLYFGPQVYGGTEAAPTFQVGTYHLTDGETLTITPVEELIFTFSGVENAQFAAMSDPTPDFFAEGTLTGLQVPYTTEDTTSEQLVTFYSGAINGGVFTPSSLYLGSQVYLGPENSPVFVPGSYELSDGETLVISGSATTPEPTSLVLLSTGLAGLVGGLRRRVRL